MNNIDGDKELLCRSSDLFLFLHSVKLSVILCQLAIGTGRGRNIEHNLDQYWHKSGVKPARG